MYKKLLLCLGLLLFVDSASATDLTSTRPDIGRTFEERLYQAMRLMPASRTDYLEDLSQTMVGVGRPTSVSNQSLDRLVADLNEPPPPRIFSDVLLPAVTIDDRASFQRASTWKYGTYLDRMALLRLLTAKTTGFEKSDPTRATNYAKASVMLCILEDFDFGNSMLGRTMSNEKLMSLTGWDTTLVKNLQQIIEEHNHQLHESEKAYDDSSDAIDRLIADRSAELPAKELADALSALDAGLKDSHYLSSNEWSFLNMAWRLTCLVRHRWDDTGIPIIAAQVARWRDSFADEPTVCKWLEETSTIPGDSPLSSGVHIIRSVDDPAYKMIMGIK